MEDLAIANLIRNKHLARAISDAAWAEFARQLAYKADWFGTELIICDRWFPSTKTCSRCGQRTREMGLAERIFSCDGCGLAMDRDRNAAANLAAWAEAASSAAAQAPSAKRAVGISTPLEGKALAIVLGMAEPAPAKGEATRTPSGHALRAPEKGGAGFLEQGCRHA